MNHEEIFESKQSFDNFRKKEIVMSAVTMAINLLVSYCIMSNAVSKVYEPNLVNSTISYITGIVTFVNFKRNISAFRDLYKSDYHQYVSNKNQQRTFLQKSERNNIDNTLTLTALFLSLIALASS